MDNSLIKKAAFIALFTGMFLFQTGCQSSQDNADLVAKTSNDEITILQFEEAETFFKNIENVNEPVKEESEAPEVSNEELQQYILDDQARKENTLNQLIFESLIQYDENIGPLNVQSKMDELWSNSLEWFDGELGLKAQLDTYNVTEKQYRESLYREAYILMHREAYENDHPISTDELSSFFEKNKETLARVSYIDITVPTRSEAEQIIDDLENEIIVNAQAEEVDANDVSQEQWFGWLYDSIQSFDQKYNNDLFDNTSVSTFEDVGLGDEMLLSQDILQQNQRKFDFYFVNNGYHVIVLKDKVSDFESLREHTQKIAFDQEYDKYIKNLAKDQNLHIFKENINLE